MAGKKAVKDTRFKPKWNATSKKRDYFKQADFPQCTLQQAEKIALALVDNFAGKQGSPADIAMGN